MTHSDHDLLTAWLEDWGLIQALEIPEDRVPSPRWEPEPSVWLDGSIRLFDPGEAGGPPLYALVVRSEYGLWTLVPFSPVSVPATPQELRLRKTGPAQVLQGWNRRLCRSQDLRSCEVDRLADQEQFDVGVWLESLRSGGPVLQGWSDRCGPVVYHPLDPRHDYMLEERERGDAILGVGESSVAGDESHLKAAESEPDYGEPDEPE